MPGCSPSERGLMRFCCQEAASLLCPREGGWVVYDGRVAVPVRFCPMCGESLPSSSELLFRECGNEGCRRPVSLRAPSGQRCPECTPARAAPGREDGREAPVIAMRRHD